MPFAMQDEFTVGLDEEDFVAAYRPRGRSQRLSKLMLLLALMITLLIGVLVVRFPEARSAYSHSPMVIGLTGVAVLAALLVMTLLLAAPALRRKAARSTLNDHPGMRDAVHYAFDDDTFSVRSTYSQAQYPWSQLWDWRECDRIILVLPTPRNFYVIPKRAIAPEVLDRLRGNLAQVRKQAKS